MLKRIIFCLTFAIALTLTLSSCAILFAKAIADSDLIYTLKEDGTYSVSSGLSQKLETLTIPERYDGKAVTEIEEQGFKDYTSLKEIVIPDTVKTIGFGAFEGCSSLESITVPFVGAKKTKTTGVPTHFGYIFGAPNSSLNGSHVPKSLKTVTVTGGKSVSSLAFENCYSLTSVAIPDTVTFMGAAVFRDCDSLTELTIPFVGNNPAPGNDLDGDMAFLFEIGSSPDNATDLPHSLTKVTVTVATMLYHKAFRNCLYLEEIILPDTLKTVWDNVFEGCESLTTLVIPDSVRYIGSNALMGCTSLESLTIPFIGRETDDNRFRYFGYLFGATNEYYSTENRTVVTESLKSVTVTGESRIPGKAFLGCQYIEEITVLNADTIGTSAFADCAALKKVTLGEGLKIIEMSVFSSSKLLEEVNLPASVTEIKAQAFMTCLSLSIIRFGGTVEEWKAVTKGSFWAFNTREIEVFCSDGRTPLGEAA